MDRIIQQAQGCSDAVQGVYPTDLRALCPDAEITSGKICETPAFFARLFEQMRHMGLDEVLRTGGQS